MRSVKSRTANVTDLRDSHQMSPFAATSSATFTRGFARVEPWLPAILLVAFFFAVNPSLMQIANNRSSSIHLAILLLAWSSWMIALMCALVPHPLSLTLSRLLALGPFVVSFTVAFIATSTQEISPIRAVICVALSCAIASSLFGRRHAERCVNGLAYPNERRLPLRIPLALLAGPLPLVIFGSAGTLPIAALLLSAKQWLPGALAGVVFLAVSYVGVPAVHRLSLRWLVFVPAGIVVRDQVALTEPLLLTKQNIQDVIVRAHGSDAFDLTEGCTGAQLEIVLRESVLVVRNNMRTRESNAFHVFKLAVAPINLREATRLYAATQHSATTRQTN